MFREILPFPVRLLPAALSLCALALVGCDDGSTSSSGDDPGKKDKVAFSSISEIYGSLDSAETVVFLIRDAADSVGPRGERHLTAKAAEAARKFGAALPKGETIFYGVPVDESTAETVTNIAVGHEDTVDSTLMAHVASLENDHLFRVSVDSLESFAAAEGLDGARELVSRWAYGDDSWPELFYEILTRGKVALGEATKDFLKWERISVLVAEEMLVMPLVVYASDRKVDLRYFDDGNWLAPLSGLAVVIRDQKIDRYVPLAAPTGAVE